MIAIQVFVQNRNHSEYKQKKMAWYYINAKDTAKHNIPYEKGVSHIAQYLSGGLYTPVLLSTSVLMVLHLDATASLQLRALVI